MVVWMKCGTTEIGIEDGIVPRASFEKLTSLESAGQEIIAKQSDLLEQAGSQARHLIDAASAKARHMHSLGLRAALASSRRGFEDARVEGLKQWHAEQAARRAEREASHVSIRDELAAMVVDATRQLVGDGGFDRYFQKALTVLDQLAEYQRALSLTVHPSDRIAAQSALSAIGKRWPDGTTVNLVEDENLVPGSALCESSEAWVDASLDQQIRALQAAAERALASIPLDSRRDRTKTTTDPAPEPATEPAAKRDPGEPKPTTKPRFKPTAEATAKVATRPATKTKAKPATKPATKTRPKVATKPTTKTRAQPATKPATKTGAKIATKPATKTKVKAATKPATKTRAKVVTKPTTRTRARPTNKPKAKRDLGDPHE